jgi:hypothetical protein
MPWEEENAIVAKGSSIKNRAFALEPKGPFGHTDHRKARAFNY